MQPPATAAVATPIGTLQRASRACMLDAPRWRCLGEAQVLTEAREGEAFTLRSVTSHRYLTPYLCPSVHFALLSSGEVAFSLQELAEVVHGGERARMPISEGLAYPLQRLA